jgi:hypothetical protein
MKKQHLESLPQHPVLAKPWTYRILRFDFLVDKRELNLMLKSSNREVALHFSGVHSLEIDEGFPDATPGIQILDARSSGMQDARVRVDNFNYEQDPGIRFWAEDVSIFKWPCPCCRWRTLTEQPPGTYEICEICGWEDDPVQFQDPSYRGGANEPSLVEARANFERSGASDIKRSPRVRKPTAQDVREGTGNETTGE